MALHAISHIIIIAEIETGPGMGRVKSNSAGGLAMPDSHPMLVKRDAIRASLADWQRALAEAIQACDLATQRSCEEQIRKRQAELGECEESITMLAQGFDRVRRL